MASITELKSDVSVPLTVASSGSSSSSSSSSSNSSNGVDHCSILTSVGIISDVQYCDIPNGQSYDKTEERYYRNSLEVARSAVTWWNKQPHLSAVIHLGDLVDGRNNRGGPQQSHAAANLLQSTIMASKAPAYFMIGNHEMYNHDRVSLCKRFGWGRSSVVGTWADLKLAHPDSFPPPPTPTIIPHDDLVASTEEPYYAYFAIQPHPGLKILVLDSYDLSVLGRPIDHPKYVQAREMLNERNKNEDENSPEGLDGVNRRWVAFNGWIDKPQLAWLEAHLEQAAKKGQAVIIAAHIPLHPGVCSEIALLWNYDEVLSMLSKWRPFLKAVVCIHGHDHKGGTYYDEESGIHHQVLEAALLCAPGRFAYGRIDLHHDRLQIVGVDRMTSATIPFTSPKPLTASAPSTVASSSSSSSSPPPSLR